MNKTLLALAAATLLAVCTLAPLPVDACTQDGGPPSACQYLEFQALANADIKDAREMCLRSSDFMACLLFTVMKTIDGPQWVQRDPMFGGRGIWLADAKHYDVLNAFDHQFGMFNDQDGEDGGFIRTYGCCDPVRFRQGKTYLRYQDSDFCDQDKWKKCVQAGLLEDCKKAGDDPWNDRCGVSDEVLQEIEQNGYVVRTY